MEPYGLQGLFCYALSLLACYAMSGTDLRDSLSMAEVSCHTMSGYRATRREVLAYALTQSNLRISYRWLGYHATHSARNDVVLNMLNVVRTSRTLCRVRY
eukprot:2330352-Rhodomonas_salina.6